MNTNQKPIGQFTGDKKQQASNSKPAEEWKPGAPIGSFTGRTNQVKNKKRLKFLENPEIVNLFDSVKSMSNSERSKAGLCGLLPTPPKSIERLLTVR